MRLIKKITSIIFFILFIVPGDLFSQKDNLQSVGDVLYPASAVLLTGYIGEKLDESLKNRILAQDADRLIEPFKPENRTETRMWQSEFWGKWFTSAVLAYKYHPNPDLKKKMDHAVSGLMATQTSDGYIGNYAKAHRLEEWDIWGRKYCMLGLLSYYDLTNEKKYLVAASLIADNLISDLNKTDGIIVTKGNYRGMAASSVLEPICLLYRYSRNKKYLDFALEIVRQWEMPGGPQLISKAQINVGVRFPKPLKWYSPEQGQKAYEMMSCYEGLLELYRLTGNPSYKKAVEETWENIFQTEIDIAGSGASTEMWFGGKAVQNEPIHHYQETCVTVTWLKLTEQLLRLTGEAKYADEVEKTYYNALLGSMNRHGAGWAKYTPLNGQRLPGSEQCGMGLNCCEASGPRGLFSIPLHMVMQSKQGIQVNYFADGNFKLQTPEGNNISLTQQTHYPASGNIELDLEVQKPETFEIGIRIPEWSKITRLKLNGVELTICQPGQIAKIKRIWKSGDKITLDLDMRGRVIETGMTYRSIAILRGPVVLARDSRFEGPGIESILRPVTDTDGFIVLSDIQHTPTNDLYLLFSAAFIPESYTENPKGAVNIILCDYASAGNGPENSFYKVWSPQLLNPSRD